MKNPNYTAPVTDLDAAPEPEKSEEGSSSAMILVVIAVGADYYLKVWKPKHDLDDADDFDNLTGEGEETVNEDELEPVPWHIPRDELEDDE